MMKKILLYLIIYLIIVLLVCVSCESKLDKAIPSSQLTDAIQNVNYSIEEKKATTGKILDIRGFVPFNIRRDQIRPTVLSVLKEVKIKYPEPEEIHIRFFITPELDSPGYASFEGGKLKITYGIPSLKEIEKHNAELNVPHPSFDTGADSLSKLLLNGKGSSCWKGLESLPWPPDQITFEEARKVYALYKRPDNQKMDYCKLLDKMSEKMGLPVLQVNRDIGLIVNYYGHISSSGDEIITLAIQ
jgi:hypothetical protein